VKDLESAGAQHWLVVEHDHGRSLVPFAEKLVRVEKENGRVVVDAPEGLFDPDIA
jgi:ribosomal 30S subunit maturation factor RimM